MYILKYRLALFTVQCMYYVFNLILQNIKTRNTNIRTILESALSIGILHFAIYQFLKGFVNERRQGRVNTIYKSPRRKKGRFKIEIRVLF